MKISIFGESHGAAIGAVIEGLPAGIKVDEAVIMQEMRRRMPVTALGGTARKEPDEPKILSGVFNGYTTGTPIAMIIENKTQRSGDYGELLNTFRPGHADFTAFKKYGGFADMRGGGHFSGRLTAPLVFAGALVRGYLEEKGIFVGAHIHSIENERDDEFLPTAELFKELKSKEFATVSGKAAERMKNAIAAAASEGDSVGGVIEAAIVGLRAGLCSSDDSAESVIAAKLFGIPSVKGVEFGREGIEKLRGSAANDAMYFNGGEPAFKSNNAGGILGGITTGEPVVVRAKIKPVPSISRPQESINIKTGENILLEIKGRHDACIIPRAVCVVEAALLISVMEMIQNEEIK